MWAKAIFKVVEKLVYFLVIFLSLVCFEVRPAAAQQTFIIEDMVRPDGLLAQDTLIAPNPDTNFSNAIEIINIQPYLTEIKLNWSYQTEDSLPLYDMASYRISSGQKKNLPLPNGPKVQNGSLMVTLGSYESLRIIVESDGSGGGAKLNVDVESLEFPPRLDVLSRDTTLSSGKPADFTPVALNRWDYGAPYATSFAVSPALPQGLSMDDGGRITGTPIAEQLATTYKVTGTRLGGSRSEDITIAVSSAVMADLDAGNVSVRVGGPITPVRPVVGSSGVQSLNYSVTPTLPAGLSMAAATGTISGTPSAVMQTTTFTVTVSDGITQASKAFNLSVLPSANAPIATPEAVTAQAGVPIQTTFTIRSDLMHDGIEYKNGNAGSLKDENGIELWGTPGYPANIDVGPKPLIFRWNNPLVGEYDGELYIFLVDTYETKVVSFKLSVTGDKTDQTIAFTSSVPNAVAGGSAYTPTATSSAQLPVQFSIETESNAICSLVAGEVRFLSEGICLVNADQPGDATTNAAPQVRQVVQC